MGACMRRRVVTGTVIIALMLSGCGSLAGRHNIDSGFTYIENHDFNNAMNSFTVAEEGRGHVPDPQGQGNRVPSYR